MAATIGANGLSVVHKGSGGEANASVPDVCLTKVGKPVVPIPYGNNAKSSDLANGSTTVTADGGNSIALQDSTFSTSTGDASGDKKGVSSGTIEGEAKFVTASSNVIIEGRGVARQTDQMTMNNANTMCFGVQNPSVTVEEAAEPTFSLDVCIRYPNGKRFTNANYALTDDSGATVGSGSLDAKGQSEAVGLKPGKVKIKAEESTDNYQITSVRRENPHYVESISDDEFFDIASKGQQTFWLPARVGTLGTPWGSIGQSLTSDVYFQDIVEAEIKRHFTHFHPETAYEFGKTCEAVIGSIDMPMPHTTETLLAYSMPLALEEGEMLSTLLRLAPHETTDRMLAYMRARGEGNPQTYLANYDWDSAQKHMNETLDTLLEKIKTRLTFLRDEASKLKYAYLSEQVFDKHIDTVSTYAKGLPDLISGSFNKMRNKAAALLADTSNVKVIKAADDTHSTEGDGIEAVVNTTKTIDTVEPFMNEVPGVIDNVIPIYPVRYGYANFFDELMPAQAPPSMTEMSSATGLKDTGGYLLRLLREGWLYIKEENEEEDSPLHIFKYAQTETATGVIEKFEKYYFTNEENAQGGLTLDTSSGSTFYPFAFVTPKAKKISIVYSEHEWAAEIIDKMNGDQEWRAKAMQQVDLSSPQTEFSQEATQGNLRALVEDYRSNDEKWLSIEPGTPRKYGLDAVTTKNSYYLSSEGVAEMMRKSHSKHKDGALVALYDPVGRQSDLAFALTLISGYQKLGDPETIYPRTIGKIVSGFLEHPNEEIQSIAKENVDETALNAFFLESKEEELNFKERREALLDIYSAFAYQDLADGTVGSLDSYLKMYFDIDSSILKAPESEIEKLTLIAAAIFEGHGVSEEGQAALISMVNDAYENDSDIGSSQNIYFIITQLIQSILLQCQEQFDWYKVISNTPVTLSRLWSQARATGVYGAKLTEKASYKLTAKALSQIADSFLPTYFEKVHGIVYTGEKVRVTHDKLAELIARQIDSGRKSNRSITRTESNLKWARKLFKWADVQKLDTIPRYYELSEIKIVREVQYSGRLQTLEATTILDYVGLAGDGVISGFSWYANFGVLCDVLAQSDYDETDPLERSGVIYDSSKLISAFAAIIADTAVVSRASLIFVNKGLSAQQLTTVAQKVLPKTKIGLNRLDMLLKARVFSRVIAVANVAMVFVAIGDGYDDWKSGNVGSLAGNVSIGLGSAIFAYGAAYYAITGAAIALTWGVAAFVLIVAGGVLSWLYGKGAFENLLYRCFWGTSNNYSFWYFEEEGENSNLEKRLNLAKANVDNPLYKTAFQIEVQEFMNFLMQPSITVSKTGRLFRNNKRFTYDFVLPNFIWGRSELVGSVQNTTLDIFQPIQDINNVSSLDESGTGTFMKALEEALSNPAKRRLENGTLHLKVEADLNEDAELHWYYKPTPDVVVPKRMLTSNGELKRTYIGMKDDEPMDAL